MYHGNPRGEYGRHAASGPHIGQQIPEMSGLGWNGEEGEIWRESSSDDNI